MQILRSPYNLFLLTGLVLILTCFLTDNGGVVDIHLHDTYIVVAHGHILLLFAVGVLFLWSAYKVIRAMFRSKLLTWIHVIMTISAVFLLLYSLFFGTDVFSSTPKRYIDLSGWDHFSNLSGNLQLAVYSTFLLVIAQAAFVVNLVAGFLRRVM